LAEGIPPQKMLKILGSLEDSKTAERIIKETINKFGRIDILVYIFHLNFNLKFFN